MPKGGSGSDLYLGAFNTFDGNGNTITVEASGGDMIDGGGGDDYLLLGLYSEFAGLNATVTSIEFVELFALGDSESSVYFDGFDGDLETITVRIALEDLSLLGVAAGVDVGVSNAQGVEIYVGVDGESGGETLELTLENADIDLVLSDAVATLNVYAAGEDDLSVDVSAEALDVVNFSGGVSGQAVDFDFISAGISTFDGGESDADITLTGLDGALLSSVSTGSGDDSVTIIGGTVSGATISTGSGDDSVSHSGSISNSDIHLGAGEDILNIADDVTSGSTITGGSGDDTIAIYGYVSGSSVSGGSGDDVLHVADGVWEASVDMGDGDDTVRIGNVSGNSTTEVSGSSALLYDTLLDLGAGDSDVMIGGSEGDSGTADDFSLHGGIRMGMLDAGLSAGEDSSDEHYIFIGGEVFAVGMSGDTIEMGAENSTIDVNGSDSMVVAHGAANISNDGASGNINGTVTGGVWGSGSVAVEGEGNSIHLGLYVESEAVAFTDDESGASVGVDLTLNGGLMDDSSLFVFGSGNVATVFGVSDFSSDTSISGFVTPSSIDTDLSYAFGATSGASIDVSGAENVVVVGGSTSAYVEATGTDPNYHSLDQSLTLGLSGEDTDMNMSGSGNLVAIGGTSRTAVFASGSNTDIHFSINGSIGISDGADLDTYGSGNDTIVGAFGEDMLGEGFFGASGIVEFLGEDGVDLDVGATDSGYVSGSLDLALGVTDSGSLSAYGDFVEIMTGGQVEIDLMADSGGVVRTSIDMAMGVAEDAEVNIAAGSGYFGANGYVEVNMSADTSGSVISDVTIDMGVSDNGSVDIETYNYGASGSGFFSYIGGFFDVEADASDSGSVSGSVELNIGLTGDSEFHLGGEDHVGEDFFSDSESGSMPDFAWIGGSGYLRSDASGSGDSQLFAEVVIGVDDSTVTVSNDAALFIGGGIEIDVTGSGSVSGSVMMGVMSGATVSITGNEAAAVIGGSVIFDVSSGGDASLEYVNIGVFGDGTDVTFGDGDYTASIGGHIIEEYGSDSGNLDINQAQIGVFDAATVAFGNGDNEVYIGNVASGDGFFGDSEGDDYGSGDVGIFGDASVTFGAGQNDVTIYGNVFYGGSLTFADVSGGSGSYEEVGEDLVFVPAGNDVTITGDIGHYSGGDATVTFGDSANILHVGDDIRSNASGSGYTADVTVTFGNGDNTLDVGDDIRAGADDSGSASISVVFGDGNNTMYGDEDIRSSAYGSGATADVTVTFGNGDNALEASGDIFAYTEGSGSASTTVVFGDGNNTVDVGDDVRADGSGATVDLSFGNGNNVLDIDDEIEASGSGTINITFGDGANELHVSSEIDADYDASITLEFGDGGNEMYVGSGISVAQSGDVSITFGSGNDLLEVSGLVGVSGSGGGSGSNINIDMGAGEDTVTVIGSIAMSGASNMIDIDLGADDDVMTVTGDVNMDGSGIIRGGSGHDEITIGQFESTEVTWDASGAAPLEGQPGGYFSSGTIALGDGDDWIRVANSVYGSIIGGSGNDTIDIHGQLGDSGYVDGGAGEDTLNIGMHYTGSIAVDSGSIDLGSDDDAMNVYLINSGMSGLSSGSSSHGGSGDDTLTIVGTGDAIVSGASVTSFETVNLQLEENPSGGNAMSLSLSGITGASTINLINGNKLDSETGTTSGGVEYETFDTFSGDVATFFVNDAEHGDSVVVKSGEMTAAGNQFVGEIKIDDSESAHLEGDVVTVCIDGVSYDYTVTLADLTGDVAENIAAGIAVAIGSAGLDLTIGEDGYLTLVGEDGAEHEVEFSSTASGDGFESIQGGGVDDDGGFERSLLDGGRGYVNHDIDSASIDVRVDIGFDWTAESDNAFEVVISGSSSFDLNLTGGAGLEELHIYVNDDHDHGIDVNGIASGGDINVTHDGNGEITLDGIGNSRLNATGSGNINASFGAMSASGFFGLEIATGGGDDRVFLDLGVSGTTLSDLGTIDLGDGYDEVIVNLSEYDSGASIFLNDFSGVSNVESLVLVKSDQNADGDIIVVLDDDAIGISSVTIGAVAEASVSGGISLDGSFAGHLNVNVFGDTSLMNFVSSGHSDNIAINLGAGATSDEELEFNDIAEETFELFVSGGNSIDVLMGRNANFGLLGATYSGDTTIELEEARDNTVYLADLQTDVESGSATVNIKVGIAGDGADTLIADDSGSADLHIEVSGSGGFNSIELHASTVRDGIDDDCDDAEPTAAGDVTIIGADSWASNNSGYSFYVDASAIDAESVTIDFRDETGESYSGDVAENLELIGSESSENTIFDGQGDDIIIGGSVNDILAGGFGDDDISGFSGIDEIFGDAGSDWMNGGSGDDILVGDLIRDAFTVSFDGDYDIGDIITLDLGFASGSFTHTYGSGDTAEDIRDNLVSQVEAAVSGSGIDVRVFANDDGSMTVENVYSGSTVFDRDDMLTYNESGGDAGVWVDQAAAIQEIAAVGAGSSGNTTFMTFLANGTTFMVTFDGLGGETWGAAGVGAVTEDYVETAIGITSIEVTYETDFSDITLKLIDDTGEGFTPVNTLYSSEGALMASAYNGYTAQDNPIVTDASDYSADVFTGGEGSDLFIIAQSQFDNMDTITDFNLGASGDTVMLGGGAISQDGITVGGQGDATSGTGLTITSIVNAGAVTEMNEYQPDLEAAVNELFGVGKVFGSTSPGGSNTAGLFEYDGATYLIATGDDRAFEFGDDDFIIDVTGFTGALELGNFMTTEI